jgi:hypothetical protein
MSAMWKRPALWTTSMISCFFTMFVATQKRMPAIHASGTRSSWEARKYAMISFSANLK